MNGLDKKITVGFSLAFVGLILLFAGLFMTNFVRNSYYFDNSSENIGNKVSVNYTRKGEYDTVIVYDNVYQGVKIKNKSDITNLIVEDSESQKVNCPSEIKSIEDEIIKKYGITAVNLCEMDLNFARELGNVIGKIYQEYPSARGYLSNLTIANSGGEISENTIAAFQGAFPFATSNSSSSYPWAIKTLLILNAKYFLNPDRLQLNANKNAATGWFPKGTTKYSTVAHELGHYLAFIATLKHYGLDSITLIDNKNVDKYYTMIKNHNNSTYAYEILNKAYKKYQQDNGNLNFDAWRAMISKYAIAKDNSGNYIYHETIAEAFHDVYLNGNLAEVASQYIVQVLKSELEVES